ncbi:hypothetical protein [Sulfurovum sp.]|uniref:hypothetical protein n=1 Tax=Sulfurovum sp. TaxID=1969726 RepID=UPI00356228B4
MKKIILVLLVIQNFLYADFENEKWYECVNIDPAAEVKKIGIRRTMAIGSDTLQLMNRNVAVEDIYFAKEIAKGSKIYKFKTALGEYIVEETKDGAKLTNLYYKNNNYVDFETYLSCKVQAR